MGLSVETLAVAKKYTDSSISGISGTLAGKNCTIQSITDIEGGHRVTFQWTADDSTVRTSTMDVMDGSGAEAIEQIYADNGLLGAKNLLENTANNKSSGNVDFTVNADKTITVNTTGTVSAVQTLAIGEVKGLQGNYILNGVTGGSPSTYGIQLYDVTTSTWIAQYATDGDSVISLADGTHTYRFVLYVRNGATVSGAVVKPMLRLASDTDSTYVPYAMTNRELTELNTPVAIDLIAATGIDFNGNNKSMVCGNVKVIRTQVHVSSEIATETAIITAEGYPHKGYGGTVLIESNTGSVIPCVVINSDYRTAICCKATIPTGYYVINYTFI